MRLKAEESAEEPQGTGDALVQSMVPMGTPDWAGGRSHPFWQLQSSRINMSVQPQAERAHILERLAYSSHLI